MDHPSHQHTKADADKQCEGDADQWMNTNHCGTVSNDHACQGRHCADRQVNTACDQYHGHTDSGYAVVGIVHKQGGKCTKRSKTDFSVHHRAKQIDQQEQADRRVHHDKLGIHDAAEQALSGGSQFSFHALTPPLILSRLRLDRLAK